MPTANRDLLPRLCDLLDGFGKPKLCRTWLQGLAKEIVEDPRQRQKFLAIEKDIAVLPAPAWAQLKAEITRQINRHDPKQGWPQTIDLLHQARAYTYLVRLGCTDIEFLSASSTTKTPDLRATLGTLQVLCEVKTIRVPSLEADGSLPHLFFKKLASRLDDATKQLASFCQDDGSQRIIHIVLNVDDNPHAYSATYVGQIQTFMTALPSSDTDIVFDIQLAFHAATPSATTSCLFICTRDRSWRSL